MNETREAERTVEERELWDKLWFLAVVLLRRGRSCTPVELSTECYLLNFSSEEVEALCKAPKSPLSLTNCGKVTFSHLAFSIFEGVKCHYELPSHSSVSMPTNSPIQKSLSYCIKSLPEHHCSHQNQHCLSYPSTPYFSGPFQSTSNYSKLGAASLYLPMSSPSPALMFTLSELQNFVIGYTKFLSSSEKLPPEGALLSNFFKKRSRPELFSSFSTSKRYKMSVASSSFITDSYCNGQRNEANLQLESSLSSCFHGEGGDGGGNGPFSWAHCSAGLLTSSPVLLSDGKHEAGLHSMFHEYHDGGVKSDLCIQVVKKQENSLADELLESQFKPFDTKDNKMDPSGIKLQESEAQGLKRKESLPEFEASQLFKQPIKKNEDEAPLEIKGMNGVTKSRSEEAKHTGTTTQIFKTMKARGKGKRCTHQNLDVSRQVKKASRAGKANHIEMTLVDKGAGQSQAHVLPAKTHILPSNAAETRANCKEQLEAIQQQLEAKVPAFEGYAVEAVEGQGGYGTVYKAVRKSDGKLFAIKCPFEKTSPTYVSNEIEMLQRFGGRHSIPKYEGVIQESGRICLILEYIEHEKPEVLKKEISISEIRWYGYFLFKALAFLHGKGIIHRDVKLGNFLFSRQRNCGSLIDFNLAVVQPKQAPTKSKKNLHNGEIAESRKGGGGLSVSYRTEMEFSLKNGTRLPRKHPKPLSQQSQPSQLRVKSNWEYASHASEKASSPKGTPVRILKKNAEDTHGFLSRPQQAIQITPTRHANRGSPKEAGQEPAIRDRSKLFGGRNSPLNGKAVGSTETASPALMRGLRSHSVIYMSPSRELERAIQSGQVLSGDLSKEPLPRTGRRELLDYVEKKVNSPQPQLAPILGSQRKRVAAPPKRKNQEIMISRGLSRRSVSPVLKRSTLVTAQTGQLPARSKGSRKNPKEGPCAGTKGYRAPEVLLRSLFQSAKLDIWSAGVTLLHLLIGRSPFPSTSTDQSLLDIARFCGAEVILNLAKEHRREDSLSKDFASHRIEPISLKTWCESSSKRSEIPDTVPLSLYDLIEKCLQVNPELRISAAEAIQHSFFTPCRQATSSKSITNC